MYSESDWMRVAIQQAKIAQSLNEVPVGAVLVREQEIIGLGYNQPILRHDCSAHAEIQALREAGTKMGNYRLPDTKLFVTLEPCAMCAAALVHARVAELVFGAFDAKTGVVISRMQFFDTNFINHKVQWRGGILEQECKQLLQEFFQSRR